VSNLYNPGFSTVVKVDALVAVSTQFLRSVEPYCIAYSSTIRDAAIRLTPELGSPTISDHDYCVILGSTRPRVSSVHARQTRLMRGQTSATRTRINAPGPQRVHVRARHDCLMRRISGKRIRNFWKAVDIFFITLKP